MTEKKQALEHHKIEKILYYIGGGIVFLGIIILVVQNWSSLDSITKILVTLGSGIASFFTALLLDLDKRTKSVSSAFYLISALVMPTGILVTFNVAGIVLELGILTITSFILFTIFLFTSILQKKNILTLFAILFGTSLFITSTSWFVLNDLLPDFDEFPLYQIIIVGSAYIFLAHQFSKNYRAQLSGFLYGFGIFGILGSIFLLGFSQNFWEYIYPIIVFGAIFGSVSVKSKTFLTWGTIFLMAYIIKITSKYFSTGLGWPFALVLAGLAMIAVAAVSFSLKKKYFKEK